MEKKRGTGDNRGEGEMGDGGKGGGGGEGSVGLRWMKVIGESRLAASIPRVRDPPLEPRSLFFALFSRPCLCATPIDATCSRQHSLYSLSSAPLAHARVATRVGYVHASVCLHVYV